MIMIAIAVAVLLWACAQVRTNQRVLERTRAAEDRMRLLYKTGCCVTCQLRHRTPAELFDVDRLS